MFLKLNEPTNNLIGWHTVTLHDTGCGWLETRSRWVPAYFPRLSSVDSDGVWVGAVWWLYWESLDESIRNKLHID